MKKIVYKIVICLLLLFNVLPIFGLYYLSYWLQNNLSDELANIPIKSIEGVIGVILIFVVVYVAFLASSALFLITDPIYHKYRNR